VPADRPGYLAGPERQPGAELARRLDRLPPGHPSSPGYGDGGSAASAERDPADQRVPAARRPEWQEPLAQGIGSGVVDERASQFSPPERRIAEVLAGEGRAAVAVHDGYGAEGRRPDAGRGRHRDGVQEPGSGRQR
jgi:hypothetical protein